MRILAAGASGLVGTALVHELKSAGHEVIRLVRRPPGSGEIQWNPSAGQLDASRLAAFEGVIHLGGDNIAKGRWTNAKRKRIRDSRVNSTTLLSETIARAAVPPKFLVCASATGYYGDRAAETLYEDSKPGEGFLADVCQEWEKATGVAADAGVRVVNLRIGIVLAKGGGALKKLLLPFTLGLGGIVGNGKQYWSCIPLKELLPLIQYCAENDSIAGPVNAVTPSPPTNYEFTKALGRILNRPTFLPFPGVLAKILLGEMAETLMLASARVEPRKLLESGYSFTFPDIESSLRAGLRP